MYNKYFNIEDLKKNQIKKIHYFDNDKKLYAYELYNKCDLEKYKGVQMVRYDVLSYGRCVGCFITNFNTLRYLALNPNKNMIEQKHEKFNDDGILTYTKSFFNILCFVENKTKYYVLHFDFDFKIDKHPEDYIGFETAHDKITDYILEKIIISLNEALNLTKKQLQYIWACKEKSTGYHIYFPNITVDKVLHQYIFDKTIEQIENDKIYPSNLINKVFDSVVCKGSNGLRLFYYVHNNDFYFPFQEKSTYQFDPEPMKHFYLCIINTNYDVFNFDLKINYDLIYKNNLILDKKIIKKGGTEEEAIVDFKSVDIGNKKDLIVSLGNILSVKKRIEPYNNWISLVYLYLNLGLFNEIVELSKKVKGDDKYNEDTYKIIVKISTNIHVRKNVKIIGPGTLIMWAKEDNLDATNKIFAKYYLSIKLNISHIDEITQKLFNIKPDFVENFIHISNEAIDFFKSKIKEAGEEQLCILMQSPTGTGKTTAVNKIDDFITEYFKSYTFLSTVTRRSMVACQITAFSKGKLSFSSYLDESIESLDYFISSLENLIRVDDLYDVIILDEVNSLVNYFYSETLKNKRSDCIAKLLKLINKSKIIIACDANITDLVFSIFNQINIKFVYYKNEFLNKLNIPLDIYYSTKYNENLNLYAFCDKFIVDKVKNNKSVLILTDSKSITENLKDYLYNVNKNYDYFRVFNKDEGTLQDLIDIDKLSENRCILANSKILYGIDMLYKYDEIFIIYRYASGYGIDCFCMIQQMSRARKTKKVNMLVLDPKAKHYFNTFISYEENKVNQEKFINGYYKFHEELCKKHSVVNEFGCTTLTMDGKKEFNVNSIMTEIHYIKTWYDMLFNNNKIDIVKLIAEKSYGYKIKCIDWEPVEKYEYLNPKKIDKNAIIEVSKQIYEGNIDNIPEKYVKCIDNLQEQIVLRERYLKDVNESELFQKLSCDANAFQNYIYRKYLDLNEAEFNKKIIELNNKDVMSIIKTDDLINKILSLFWLEKTLNIKRFNIDDIKTENLEDIKTILNANVEKLYWFFKTTDKKKNILNNIKKKISDITNLNNLQKCIVECYNSIANDTFVVREKFKRINNNVHRYYLFIKK